MSQFRAHKYVSALPAQLEPSAVYFVRAGAGFDLYVTNETGTVVAYALNTGAAAVPTYVSDTYAVAANSQALYSDEIEVDGELVIDGVLVEVA